MSHVAHTGGTFVRLRLLLMLSIATALIGSLVASPAGAAGRSYQLTDLGTLGGRSSFPVGVNDDGQVFGSAATASGQMQAFVWENGRMTGLGPAGGSSLAETFSKRLVVGTSATGGAQHATLWRRGQLIDLGTLGQPTSWALDVNQHGAVVGVSALQGGEGGPTVQHPFFWRKGQMYDLASLVANLAGWTLDARLAGHINRHGWIAASAGAASGSHAVVLRPIGRAAAADDGDD
jgi:probable HAF family extracellular repeat protein